MEKLEGALMWKIEKVVSKGEYNYAVVKEHPKSTKHGYVLEHRVIMENHLGRVLNPNEVVHHLNEDKKDNRIQNLQLLLASEHVKLHQLQKGTKMVLLKCPHCKSLFEKERRNTHIVKRNKFTCCSKHCRGKFSSFIQHHGVTHQVQQAISENILKEYNSLDNFEQTVLQQDA